MAGETEDAPERPQTPVSAAASREFEALFAALDAAPAA
jgi:hypothetical protein